MFPYNFPLQEIPSQRPVSGTALSLQEIIIVGNCEKQVFFTAFRGPLRLIFVGKVVIKWQKRLKKVYTQTS